MHLFQASVSFSGIHSLTAAGPDYSMANSLPAYNKCLNTEARFPAIEYNGKKTFLKVKKRMLISGLPKKSE
jgi:hypothetical protein